MKRGFLFCLLLAAALGSCRKKDDPVTTTPVPEGNGEMKVTFQNVVGFQPLILNDAWYQNENGDSFKVSLYKYYISNVILIKEDGQEYTELQSYHLINEAEGTTRSFIMKDVPPGSYTKIRFMIGVDSRANTEGAQTGDLDPILGMYWDWNTGYIAAKMEGYSPQSQSALQKLTFHIGGYQGIYQVTRNIALDLPAEAVTNKVTTPNIHIKANLLEWFKTPYTISFQTMSHAMDPGKDVSHFADNYSDMFKVDHID